MILRVLLVACLFGAAISRGVDASDKPFKLVVEYRKLDAMFTTTQSVLYASTLTDCYNYCKEAGDACSSFSFCPDTPKEDKECLITSEMVIKGVTPEWDLIADKYCNVYARVDAGDKPFKLVVEYRKLDAKFTTTQSVLYASTLTDCYNYCKEAGGACSSFSFCPDTPKEDKECLITSEMVIKGVTPEWDLIADKYCNVYAPRYLDYFEQYPGKISLLPGDLSIRSVNSAESCAEKCRKEKSIVCRGFEYCRSRKTCTLHKKHILDLKPGETGSSKAECSYYDARYVADYKNMGTTLVEDNSNVRYGTTLDECAKICSVELGTSCKSFNYCPPVDYSDTTCSLSLKLISDDGVTTTEKKSCMHYEKRDVVHDWDKLKSKELSTSGYTKKGFTGEGMAVRFMKNDA